MDHRSFDEFTNHSPDCLTVRSPPPGHSPDGAALTSRCGPHEVLSALSWANAGTAWVGAFTGASGGGDSPDSRESHSDAAVGELVDSGSRIRGNRDAWSFSEACHFFQYSCICHAF